jgi:hypothetical protein
MPQNQVEEAFMIKAVVVVEQFITSTAEFQRVPSKNEPPAIISFLPSP